MKLRYTLPKNQGSSGFNSFKKVRYARYTWVFLLGFFSCACLFYMFSYSGVEVPMSGFGVLYSGFGVSAPNDWVSEKDIIIFDDMIVLRVENATLSSYAGTGSMKPVFDKGANGIRVVPGSADEIDVGDIVSYKFGPQLDSLWHQTGQGMLVVHRVVDKGIDDEGVYFVMKGDNNLIADERVRFEDVEYVTVGVIW